VAIVNAHTTIYLKFLLYVTHILDGALRGVWEYRVD